MSSLRTNHISPRGPLEEREKGLPDPIFTCISFLNPFRPPPVLLHWIKNRRYCVMLWDYKTAALWDLWDNEISILRDNKIARLQDCGTAGLWDCGTARPAGVWDCDIAGLQEFSTAGSQCCRTCGLRDTIFPQTSDCDFPCSFGVFLLIAGLSMCNFYML